MRCCTFSYTYVIRRSFRSLECPRPSRSVRQCSLYFINSRCLTSSSARITPQSYLQIYLCHVHLYTHVHTDIYLFILIDERKSESQTRTVCWLFISIYRVVSLALLCYMQSHRSPFQQAKRPQNEISTSQNNPIKLISDYPPSGSRDEILQFLRSFQSHNYLVRNTARFAVAAPNMPDWSQDID